MSELSGRVKCETCCGTGVEECPAYWDGAAECSQCEGEGEIPITESEQICRNCEGSGWVCENHPCIAWYGLSGKFRCCGGAGMPCQVCNNEPDPISNIKDKTDA